MQTPEMVDFIGGLYELQGTSFSQRKAINCFLQSGEGSAKYSKLLLGTPGTSLVANLEVEAGGSNFGCRGLWMTDNGQFTGGTLYWVFGSKLGSTYKDPLSGDLISNVLYDIGFSTTRCSMTDNGAYLILVNGFDMYKVDIFTDEVTSLTNDLPFTKPIQVVYLGGRIVCISDDDSKTTKKTLGQVLKNQVIWWSDLGIGGESVWDGLSFISAEASSDPITSIAVRQGDLWAFGTRSYQVFNVTTNSDSPFEFAQGSSTSIGCNAPYSATAIGDNIFWMGSNASGRNVIFAGSGFNSVRISNHGIESILQEFGDLTTNAYGFAYQEAGHLFYCLTIPSGNYVKEGQILFTEGRTIVYDVLTQQWHERASREPLTGKLQAWQPLFSAYAFGKIIVGNLLFPALMELRGDVYTDYYPLSLSGTKPIYREFQSSVMFKDLKLFVLQEFQIDMNVGHAPLNGLSSNPKMGLQISKDSGNTWGSIRQREIGRVGNYAGRVRWVNNGSARNFVLRLICTEDMLFQLGEGRTRTNVSVKP